ncbi:MAG TPA: hypothetical protein PLU87_09410 [Sedimentisphaerales bacterium]|nr:hypothetical protein [Sedimentisphaerales bacterium]HRS11336.1 hypothetical protein [Sedimentisphaerales bacterium]HRV47908.1 hypothetical protein [Sedimentisphaerales bacterium]
MTSATAPPRQRLRGEVVYIYAFDLAYDMKRQPIPAILDQPVREYFVGPSKPGPKQAFFYKPQMVTLAPSLCRTSLGAFAISYTIKLFNVGAISVQVRVPFEVDAIGDLVAYYGLLLNGSTVDAEVRALVERVRRQIAPYLIRPVEDLGTGEDYTVFCIHQLPSPDGAPPRSEDWLLTNRRAIAGLLTQEPQAARLSEQEAAESTEKYLTYYETDLVVADWDAALVVGEQDSLEEILHVMELANVQLAELGAYDRVLDGALESAYRDLSRRGRVTREVRRNLREIRVDMARLNDELSNITKFFGDWHLARIYQNLSSRLHLSDWHGIINVKLRTLADLYQLLYQDWINAWMVVLETTIVLLFILDVLLLLLGL